MGKAEDLFAELEEKYGIQGYDDSSVIVSYEVFKSLAEKAEKHDKWREAISKGLRRR